MPSRIEQFEALLRKDGNLALTDEQVHHVASLLAFSGAGLPLPVWTTREELEAAPTFTIIEDSDDATWELWNFDQWYCVRDEGAYALDAIKLPVKVRWLPPEGDPS